jgi:hypothetical protein
VDEDPEPPLPERRAGEAVEGAPSARSGGDNPAREYNRPAGAKLLDVPGLLVVLGLVVAGVLLALAVTHGVI